MPDWRTVAVELGRVLGMRFSPDAVMPVTGGDTNAAAVLCAAQGGYRVFVKYDHANDLQSYRAEAEGLKALAATGTVRAPKPLWYGDGAGGTFLVLEYLDLQPLGEHAADTLSRRLAAMHRSIQPRFG